MLSWVSLLGASLGSFSKQYFLSLSHVALVEQGCLSCLHTFVVGMWASFFILESFTFAFTLTGLCITSYGVTICCWDVHGKVYVQAGFRCARRHDWGELVAILVGWVDVVHHWCLGWMCVVIPIVANTSDAAWTLCLVSITVGPLSCHLHKLRVSADMFVVLICYLSVDNFYWVHLNSLFGILIQPRYP